MSWKYLIIDHNRAKYILEINCYNIYWLSFVVFFWKMQFKYYWIYLQVLRYSVENIPYALLFFVKLKRVGIN